jgi:hypothetical protein
MTETEITSVHLMRDLTIELPAHLVSRSVS